jgi:hypothetical protein
MARSNWRCSAEATGPQSDHECERAEGDVNGRVSRPLRKNLLDDVAEPSVALTKATAITASAPLRPIAMVRRDVTRGLQRA